MAQTIKAMWIKVGVDVDIQIKEDAVFQQLWATRSYDEMMMTRNAGGNDALFVRYSFGYFRGTNSYNISYVNDPPGSDPVIEKAFEDLAKAINVDFAACRQDHQGRSTLHPRPGVPHPDAGALRQPGVAALDQGLLRRRPGQALVPVRLD